MLVEYHRAISMRGEQEEGGIGIKQTRAGRVRIPRFSRRCAQTLALKELLFEF
jgi:hypothetical protein